MSSRRLLPGSFLSLDLLHRLGGPPAFGELVAGGDLRLVGAGRRVLEVLALLQGLRHTDHREPGERGKGNREADLQPAGK